MLWISVNSFLLFMRRIRPLVCINPFCLKHKWSNFNALNWYILPAALISLKCKDSLPQFTSLICLRRLHRYKDSLPQIILV